MEASDPTRRWACMRARALPGAAGECSPACGTGLGRLRVTLVAVLRETRRHPHSLLEEGLVGVEPLGHVDGGGVLRAVAASLEHSQFIGRSGVDLNGWLYARLDAPPDRDPA